MALDERSLKICAESQGTCGVANGLMGIADLVCMFNVALGSHLSMLISFT